MIPKADQWLQRPELAQTQGGGQDRPLHSRAPSPCTPQAQGFFSCFET